MSRKLKTIPVEVLHVKNGLQSPLMSYPTLHIQINFYQQKMFFSFPILELGTLCYSQFNLVLEAHTVTI